MRTQSFEEIEGLLNDYSMIPICKDGKVTQKSGEIENTVTMDTRGIRSDSCG